MELIVSLDITNDKATFIVNFGNVFELLLVGLHLLVGQISCCSVLDILDCGEKLQTIHPHTINAKGNMFLSFEELWGNFNIILYFWSRLCPCGLSFEAANILSKDFLSQQHIFNGYRAVLDTNSDSLLEVFNCG